MVLGCRFGHGTYYWPLNRKLWYLFTLILTSISLCLMEITRNNFLTTHFPTAFLRTPQMALLERVRRNVAVGQRQLHEFMAVAMQQSELVLPRLNCRFINFFSDKRLFTSKNVKGMFQDICVRNNAHVKSANPFLHLPYARYLPVSGSDEMFLARIFIQRFLFRGFLSSWTVLTETLHEMLIQKMFAKHSRQILNIILTKISR